MLYTALSSVASSPRDLSFNSRGPIAYFFIIITIRIYVAILLLLCAPQCVYVCAAAEFSRNSPRITALCHYGDGFARAKEITLLQLYRRSVIILYGTRITLAAYELRPLRRKSTSRPFRVASA